MKNSKSYYDKIASSYNSQVEARINYLNAIDDYIIADAHGKVDKYLDVGSGDGRRSIKISNGIRVTSETVLVDDSSKMINNFEGNNSIKVFNQSVFDFQHPSNFDFITCLWNVLGHFPSKNARIELFKKISDLLNTNGVFIFDVNNRYNIAHYGFKNVERNIKNDNLNVDESGWFVLGEEPHQTKVYVHSPFDIEEYLLETDLVLEEAKYFDYQTGLIKETFFEGQLFYKMRKP